MQSFISWIYLSSKIFNGKIVLGKNIALDKGKIAISFGKLFFFIFLNLYLKTKK
tara:strand:+ start:340 stop:501 length:162 start_codon:yes stop_codon:yes gene_type:complete